MAASHIYSGSSSKLGHGCGGTIKTNKKTNTKTRLFRKQPQKATLETCDLVMFYLLMATAHIYSGSQVAALKVNDNDKDKDKGKYNHKTIK